MKLLLVLVVAPLGLALASGLAVLVDQHRLGLNTVYSVAMVRTDLARQPSAWLGRSVLVQGFLDGCLHPVCDGHEA
jgi:hypothetical protein